MANGVTRNVTCAVNMKLVALGSIVVTCLPLHPRFAGSNPADDDEFLRELRIRSTTSYGGEVKPSVPCRKILQRVKEPYEYERDTSYAKFTGHNFATLPLLSY
jgi:hypothetical protein